MTTNIEWVRNPDGTKGETWPVVTGCTPVSAGCANCPAARMAATRLKHHPRYAGLAEMRDGKPRWTGEVRLNHDVLGYPASWRKPRRIFVASMGDLFHPLAPYQFIRNVWDVMERNRQHVCQILTKRPARMARFFEKSTLRDNPHIWLGVTIENQETADARREAFHAAPAAIKFVSHEPALGPVDWTGWEFVDQIISGGETGPGARPGHPDWHRVTRDFCQENGINYFFKQWGAWAPGAHDRTGKIRNHGHFCADGKWINRSQAIDTAVFISRAGKRTGRLLDGQEWNEMP